MLVESEEPRGAILRVKLWVRLLAAAAVFAGITGSGVALAETPLPFSPNSTCMRCHSQPGLSTKLPSGETLPAFVDEARYGTSVHGANFACANCHEQVSGFPHAELGARNSLEYTLTHSGTCQKCHRNEYSVTRDSVHTKLLAAGNEVTPVCSDCHGSHYIESKHSKVEISKTCSRCHRAVYEDYVSSAHGKALTGAAGEDVPVCTDCHKSHDIGDPRTLTFHYQSVEICANCHTNKDVVSKYGLSTDVVKTYLQDFHGAAVTLRSREIASDIASPQTFVPVCTDCHGVHNILSVRDPESTAFKTNLVKTCQKCHEEAGANFPAAWLSHYEPSWAHARLIYVIRSGYQIMIPFIIVGLALHILVDLWRTTRKR